MGPKINDTKNTDQLLKINLRERAKKWQKQSYKSNHIEAKNVLNKV
jgi:hypothetical protein